MTRLQPNLATFTADEFARRRALASRKVAQGELGVDQANALVRPWLALACRAGADLPELRDDLAMIAEGGVLSASQARAVLADDICPRTATLEALRTATGAMIARHERGGSPRTGDLFDRAIGLMRLARAFRAGPIITQRSSQ